MSIFHDRLNSLRSEKGLTQAEISDEIDITPQAFSYYLKGREPKYDLLIKMAEYFGVTTDYLLGASEQKTPENANIGDVTGLSNSAIERIKQWNKMGWSGLASEIISDTSFTDALQQITGLFKNGLDYDKTIALLSKDNLSKLADGEKVSAVMVPGEHMVKVCAVRVKDDFSKIADKAIKYERNKASHNVGKEDK